MLLRSNASFLIGKDEIDLRNDPPPDLVVEIDRTSSSLDKHAIYAALGVREIWRLIGQRVEFHILEGDAYKSSPNSRAFPFLPDQKLSEFLVIGLTEGERKAADALRTWLRETAPATNCRNCH